jgi:hypothetical protein
VYTSRARISYFWNTRSSSSVTLSCFLPFLQRSSCSLQFEYQLFIAMSEFVDKQRRTYGRGSLLLLFSPSFTPDHYVFKRAWEIGLSTRPLRLCRASSRGRLHGRVGTNRPVDRVRRKAARSFWSHVDSQSTSDRSMTRPSYAANVS